MSDSNTKVNAGFRDSREARSMKLIGAVFCVATISTVGVSAQTETYKSESREDRAKTTVERTIKIKEGTEVPVIGCLDRNPGGGYMLTNADVGGMRYALVADDDLAKYLDHRVQVIGKATDRGRGKIKIQSKTRVETTVGTSGRLESTATTEHDGTLGLPYLGVKSVKSLADFCR